MMKRKRDDIDVKRLPFEFVQGIDVQGWKSSSEVEITLKGGNVIKRKLAEVKEFVEEFTYFVRFNKWKQPKDD
jgi:predicted transcriptional regulator